MGLASYMRNAHSLLASYVNQKYWHLREFCSCCNTVVLGVLAGVLAVSLVLLFFIIISKLLYKGMMIVG